MSGVITVLYVSLKALLTVSTSAPQLLQAYIWDAVPGCDTSQPEKGRFIGQSCCKGWTRLIRLAYVLYKVTVWTSHLGTSEIGLALGSVCVSKFLGHGSPLAV